MEEKIQWIERTVEPPRKRALTGTQLERARLRQQRREAWILDNPSKAQQMAIKADPCPRCGKSGQPFIEQWHRSCLDCVLTHQEWEKKIGRRAK